MGYEIHTGNDEFLNVINSDNGVANYSEGIAICLNTGEMTVSDQWRENWQDYPTDRPRSNLGIFDYLDCEIESSYSEIGEDTILHITIENRAYTYTYTEETLIDRLVSYGKANLEIAY